MTLPLLALAAWAAWYWTRAPRDPLRVRAKTSQPVTDREWIIHGRDAAARALRWQLERTEWERRLDAHIQRCELVNADGKWRRDEQPRLLHFARPHGEGA